jgi:hypothetical protein
MSRLGNCDMYYCKADSCTPSSATLGNMHIVVFLSRLGCWTVLFVEKGDVCTIIFDDYRHTDPPYV